MLTWPSDSKSLASFLPQFTIYFLYQGIVQFAQARYQKSRHYALRAMGKAGAMDVSHTETLSEFNSGLWSIVILVVIAQGWQIWNGFKLFWVLIQHSNPDIHWYQFHQFREEMQCAALGFIFIVVGINNFINTVATLMDKGKRRRSRTQIAMLRQASSTAGVAGGVSGKIGGVAVAPGHSRSDAASGTSGLSSSSFLTPPAGDGSSPTPAQGAGAAPVASPESKKDA
jgi:TMPIT-like protein